MKNIVLKNAVLIFIGIALFFLAMDFLGLASKNYLRALNAFIVLYGIRKTIKESYLNGKMDYFENFFSGFITGVLGVFLGIVGLIVFIYLKGGETYLNTLSDTFFFVGKVSIIQYCGVLFFEGVASCVIGTLALMQLYKKDVDVSHNY
ncbi:hypothetical protein [Flavobacterium haoranii]|uniref:DUF4199 domain-containing protein n=1 Tax=Flavobacterium haoranii TaxID=683124 RepID=A0A1M6DXN1_9FLAO|nr:hypothetical protein [Flavobacterium haoranii]SHI77880.1 hypothetical protein SAMN05444337_0770 [Flavobacterium haoranii]